MTDAQGLPAQITKGIMDLPEGAADSDIRWQRGYADGEDARRPTSDDPVYVSGWCHGYCGADQCSQEEAEGAYGAWMVPPDADYAPWERPPEPDTPEREAYRAATAQATAEARETIGPGDRITRTLCGGSRGTFTFTRWDGDALCGRTVSDCHAANVIAVNGVARRFGDQVEIARASEAFRVAREAERAARGPGRPLAAGDAPTDDPVPW